MDERPEADGTPPTVHGDDRADAQRLDRRSRANDLVGYVVAKDLERLVTHGARIRAMEGGVDPEDVHQARVATRRLRSNLETLGPLVGRHWRSVVREDLQWVARALGAVRDIDVLQHSLMRAGANDAMTSDLAKERREALGALSRTLNQPRYHQLVQTLRRAGGDPPLGDRRLGARSARRVLPRLVARRWKRLRRDVRAYGRHPTIEELHDLRKRSKQLRYASELAVEVVGARAERAAKAAESFEGILGEHRDAVLALEWLRRHRSGCDSTAILHYDAVIVRQEHRVEELAAMVPSRYARLARQRTWSWLR